MYSCPTVVLLVMYFTDVIIVFAKLRITVVSTLMFYYNQ